jgi:hypothetical protein
MFLDGKDRAAFAMDARCCAKMLNHEGAKITKGVDRRTDSSD